MIARHWRGWTKPQNADAYEALLTTKMMERDWLAVAPEMEQAFRRDLAERGPAGASMPERAARQLAHTSGQVGG